MFQYLLRSIKARLAENAAIIGVVSVVVATCTLILTFAENMRTSAINTGDREDVIVLSKGAVSETGSSVGKEVADRVRALPGIAADDGVALVSTELLANTQMRQPGGAAQFMLIRGVDPIAYKVHRHLHVVAGRMPAHGTDEVIIGKRLDGTFEGLKNGGQWQGHAIVGVFEAAGSLNEAEVWMDRQALAAAMGRRVDQPASVLHLRATDAASVPGIITALDQPSIALWGLSEPKFYATFVGDTSTLVSIAIVFSLVLALGATLAATNTMYSSMLGRTKEFATLYAIGVRRGRLGALILQESLILACIGVAVGVGVASACSGLELARLWSANPLEHFPIHVGLDVVIQGGSVGLAIGLLGGIVPALSVQRMNMRNALAG